MISTPAVVAVPDSRGFTSQGCTSWINTWEQSIKTTLTKNWFRTWKCPTVIPLGKYMKEMSWKDNWKWVNNGILWHFLTPSHHISQLQSSHSIAGDVVTILNEISTYFKIKLLLNGVNHCFLVKLTASPSPQFLTPWSLPFCPSVQWLVAWDDSLDRWSAPTTTSRWESLSVTQTRSLQQNRSVTLHPAPTIASASTTSLTDILRIQDAIPATAAGMCPQQTTSGGPDPGEQYVQTVILCRDVFFLVIDSFKKFQSDFALVALVILC